MVDTPQGGLSVAAALSLGLATGCSAPEFAVPIAFVVPAGHDSFAGLDYLSLAAEYGDGRAYDFFLEAPASGSSWDIPNMPAGVDVTLAFEGLVGDGLGGDGQVVAASGSAGPLMFDPETEASARVLFTRRGRTGSLEGGPAGGTFDPRLVSLPDGRVLATGGADGFFADRDPEGLDGAWVFGVDGSDSAWSFSEVESMRGPRADHAAILVEGSGTDLDGKVLVMGTLPLVESRSGLVVVDTEQSVYEEARNTGMPEIFDPATDTWSNFGDVDTLRPLAARGHHALALIDDGLFVSGGIIFEDDLGLRASAELIRVDLDSGEAEALPQMIETRWRHTVTAIGSDRLLVVGGASVPTNQTTFPEIPDIEVYDHSDETWYRLGDLEPARADHVAVGLPDGRVLIAGGITDTDTRALAETWLIDPSDGGSWVRGPDLGTARARADARLLADGRVIVCGGESAELAPVLDCEVWSAGGTDGLGAWAPAPDPAGAWSARLGARIALLATGEALVVGGQAGADDRVEDVLVYRP